MVLHDYLYKGGPANRLRSLSLYDNSEEDDTEDDEEGSSNGRYPEGTIFSNHAPLLTEACFWGVSLDWKKATFLRGLEYLELAYHGGKEWPSWEDFSGLLQASPDLKILSLADSGPDPGDDLHVQWPEESIPLRSLHKLSISFLSPSYVADLLQRLKIPSLEDLDLDLETGNVASLVATCLTGKNSILKNLRRLKISAMVDTTPTEITAIYEHLTSLTALCINLHYLNPLYLTHLQSPSPLYLPRLEELMVMGASDYLEDLEKVIEMRKQAGRGLKKLILCNQDMIPDKKLAWFKARVESVELVDNDDDEEYTDSDSDDGIPIAMDDVWGLGPDEVD